MNNPIKAQSTTDIVAVALHLLGFTPKSSIVLLLTADNGVAASLRVDANPASFPAGLATRAAEYASPAAAVGANGSILISFEDDKAMTTAQYEAIGDKLAAVGMPIRAAVLVTGGLIMDYEGDSTDAEPFANVETTTIGLELHLNPVEFVQLPEDVPAYVAPDAAHEEAIRAHAAAARSFDPSDEAEHAAAIGTLRDIVDGHAANGTVSNDHAAWLAGVLPNPRLRDLLTASLATSDTDETALQDALLGNTSPESWDYLRNAGRALYAALGAIPEQLRADTLCMIAWTRWMDGKATHAAAFCRLAKEAQPGHKLATLLLKILNTGNLPKAAIMPH